MVEEQERKIVLDILDAYDKVKPNLDVHAKGYPSSSFLKDRVCLGIPAFGEKEGKGFAEDRYRDSDGVNLIINSLKKDDTRPLWIGLWAGANTLAQALWQIEKEEDEKEMKRLLSKLRIFSISDQDNAGKWIREHFKNQIFYIVNPTSGYSSGRKEYYQSVWPGISADKNCHGSEDGLHPGGFDGADFSLVSNSWLKKNIRSKGPLGKKYPRNVFIMEGDTPAFLGLIQNGLNVSEHPEFGGWAGRYQREKDTYIGQADAVLGCDQKIHVSPQASLWRWRKDFQNDFATRMEWAVSPSFEGTSHNPIIHLKGEKDSILLHGSLILDASESYSPDNVSLSFAYFLYPEVSSANSKDCILEQNGPILKATFHSAGTYHLILKVAGARKIPICSYKRIIVNVEDK